MLHIPGCWHFNVTRYATVMYKHGLGGWCLWACLVESGVAALQVGPVCVELVYG